MIKKKSGIVYDFVEGKSKYNLVFVHGTGCNKTFLKALANELSEYNCYLIDLPGHGESDDTGYSAENYINAIEMFVSDLEHVILIGHSLGGTLVVGASERNLPTVEASVMLSSGATYPNDCLGIVKQALEGVLDVKALGTAFGDLDNPDLIEAMSKLEPEEVFLKDFLIDKHINYVAGLEQIKVPALIITGADEIMALVEYSELMHQRIPNSQLIIEPNVMHAMPLAKKKEVAQHITAFIEKLHK